MTTSTQLKNNRLEIVLLAIIVLFVGLIYFVKLSTIPKGIYVDESTIAYNTYSIFHTGKDEYGKAFPVLFRLLGSYTPGLYIYTSIPIVALFGMEISVFRSISAVSVLVSILFFYLLTREMKLFKSRLSYYMVLVFYAIVPWLVFNARLGYEVTLAYTLFNVGLYFFYRALKNANNLIWAVFCVSLATYTAHTQRYLLPIFLGAYFFIYRKELLIKRNFKSLRRFSIWLLVLMIPNMLLAVTPAFWVKNARLTAQPPYDIVKNILVQLMMYLSPKSLFFKMPDIDLQHTVPEISVAYDWMVVPFLLGLYEIVRARKLQKYKFLILLFVVTVLPAAFSGQFISVQRLLPFLLPLMLIIGVGVDKVVTRLRPLITIFLFVAILVYSLVMLYRSYFVLFPLERFEAWNYGYADVANYVVSDQTNHYLIDNSRNPRAYILLLYYLRYPPKVYQGEVDKYYLNNYYNSPGPVFDNRFGNVEVRSLNWEADPLVDQVIIGDSLTVSEGQAIEHGLKGIYDIDYQDQTLFKAFKTSVE